MSPQQITEAQRLADALIVIESTLTWSGYMSPPILEAAALLRTLAAQAAQERPAVDVDALMAKLPVPRPGISVGGRGTWVVGYTAEQMQEHARAALRAALEGLK